jgi:hypothetical protein
MRVGSTELWTAACAAVLLVGGCGEKNAPDPGAGGSSGSGATGATAGLSSGGAGGAMAGSGGTGGAAGDAAASGAGGASVGGAASGASGSGGAGGPAGCTRLVPMGPTRRVYPLPPEATDLKFDRDDYGVVASIVIGESVRVVALHYADEVVELLDETAYTPNWSFEPTRVFAARTSSDSVDVLVSDDSGVSLIVKPSFDPIRVVELAYTNFLDLRALAIGRSGKVAFARGEDVQTLSVLNVRPLLQANPAATDLTDAVEEALTSGSDAATFDVTTPVPLDAVPNGSGIWVTAERMDAATDCVPTGQMVPCGVGAMVESFACKFRVEGWYVLSAEPFDQPHTVLESNLTLAPACGTTEPNLRFGSSLVGRDETRHHLLASDLNLQGVVIATQNELVPTAPALRSALLFKMLAGNPAEDLGELAVSDPWRDAWVAAGEGTSLACSGGRCVRLGTPATTFAAPELDFTVLFALSRPEAVYVWGRSNDTPASIVAATLGCVSE